MSSKPKKNGISTTQTVKGALRGHETDAPPPYVGPGSQMWRDFGSYRFHLMLPQAFALQVAHPVISAAVSHKKKYKEDPWGRARDSTRLLWPVIYARPEVSRRKAVELWELHRAIKGVDEKGVRFHGIDPEAYGWVHMTGFDAALRTHELFGHEVSAGTRAKMFAEWQKVGAILGIASKHLPSTEKEYWARFNSMIDDRLERTEVLEDILDRDFYARYPVPPHVPWMPEWLWSILATPWSHFMYRLTVATLPPRFRMKLGIEPTRADALRFRAFAFAFRRFYPLLPESRRYIRLAHRSIVDARRNPDAYRVSAPTRSDGGAAVTQYG